MIKYYGFIDGCIEIVTEDFRKIFKITKINHKELNTVNELELTTEINLKELELLSRWINKVVRDRYKYNYKIDVKFYTGTIYGIFPIGMNFIPIPNGDLDNMKFKAVVTIYIIRYYKK